MSKTKRPYRRRIERHIWVQGERRDPPDAMRLAKALLAHAQELAQAQNETEAAQSHQRDTSQEEATDETQT